MLKNWFDKWIWNHLGGYKTEKPLPKYAQDILDETLVDIPYVVDSHMHVLGIGTDGSGCFVHPGSFSWRNPLEWIKSNIMLSTCGVCHLSHADSNMFDRIQTLVKYFPTIPYFGMIFAFAATYDESGKVQWLDTGLHVPNKYVVEKTKESKGLIPVGSIHPFQPDLEQQFDYLVQHDVQVLKLLPNSMGFDPSCQSVRPFIELAVQYDMTIIAHVGDEHSVSGGGINNAHGNPLLWSGWLDEFPQLRIVFAHVGSEGAALSGGKQVENFDLVLHLMKKYPTQTFADISAFSSAPLRVKYLKRLLKETSIHSRLIFGSDYPLPATWISAAITSWVMYFSGLVDYRTRNALMEIQYRNPLAFNFAAMRLVRHQGYSFPPEIFYKNVEQIFSTNIFKSQ